MSCWRDDHRVGWRRVAAPRASATVHALASADLMVTLLQEFDDVFTIPTGMPPPRRRSHRIHLPNTAPIAVHPYRYPQLVKDELKHQCREMLQQGIIRPNTSAFLSPVLLVMKSDNSWRFCVDYHAINAMTVRDMFPIPVVDELLGELCGARFFTKLDLRSGYHQVLMEPTDVEKTAFQTHHGHFEFLVMLFGLTNALTTFQALMNDIMQDFIRVFVLIFVNDILIFSNSWSSHLQLVRAVLYCLREHGLAVKKSKWSFGATTVAYLGHVILADGVAMDADKVEAMRAWPPPRSVQAVRGFLGFTDYYRKSIRSYRDITAPLTQLLKRESFHWSSEAAAAFDALKDVLTTAPILQLPDFNKPFIVDYDASSSGFGVVLHQGTGPMAFFSGAIAPHHTKLDAYERELIGLVKVVHNVDKKERARK
jgi:hypothetical protein